MPKLLTELPPEPVQGRGIRPRMQTLQFFLKANPGKWVQVCTHNTALAVELVKETYSKLYPGFEFASRGKKIFAKWPG